MEIINGRTAEQWRSFDRWSLALAALLAAALVFLWLAGLGPGRATECCTVSGTATAAVPPTAVSDAEPEATVPPEAPLPAITPPEDVCPATVDTAVRFDSGSATLSSDAREVLDDLVPCLDDGILRVEGHADSSGNDAINLPLADARARAVVEFLASRGVDESRLRWEGHGSSRPVADNGSPEGRARNRRAEIRKQ